MLIFARSYGLTGLVRISVKVICFRLSLKLFMGYQFSWEIEQSNGKSEDDLHSILTAPSCLMLIGLNDHGHFLIGYFY